MKPHLAICIGHSRLINGHPEGGAISHDGKKSEWNYNLSLAILIRQELKSHGIRAEIVSKYEGASYGSAQRWLAGHLRELEVIAAIELHFNAADSPEAHGHEWLYWSTSGHGKRLAQCLEAEMCLGVPELRTRGIKPKGTGDRGAEFLRGTHCPAVICEPFFGTSPSDWATAQAKQAKIAKAIAEGVMEFLD